MDSRAKIQTWDELRPELEGQSWTVAVGVFPLLTASIAHQLKEAKSPGDHLLVVIRRSQHELLNPSARAILFAALDVVDAVMIEESEAWLNILSHTQGVRVVDFTRRDLAAIQDLESRVLRLRAPAQVD